MGAVELIASSPPPHPAEVWVPGSVGLLITGLPLLWFIHLLVLGFLSYQWQEVPVTIVSSKVEYSKLRSRFRLGFARITYRYEQDAISRTSDVIRFGSGIEGNASIAQELIARYPAGAQTTARVRGRHATLLPGPSGWLFIYICLCAFIFSAIIYGIATGT